MRKYNKRYRKKRTQTNYKKRLKDARINTPLEKKIKEIAKREDDKNIKWYVNGTYITANTSINDWTSNIARPQYTACKEIVGGVVSYYNLTQFGEGGFRDPTISNDIGGLITNPAQDRGRVAGRISFGVRQVQAKLTFINQLPYSVTVRAILVYIPNINSQTVAVIDSLLPNIHMFKSSPNTKFDGIFGQNHRLRNNSTETNSAVDFSIIDSKTMTLPAARITYSQATNVRSIDFRRMSLNQRYKNEKLLYMSPNSGGASFPTIMSNGNYYLAICSDAPNAGEDDKVLCYGLAGCKYRVRGVTGSLVDGIFPSNT